MVTLLRFQAVGLLGVGVQLLALWTLVEGAGLDHRAGTLLAVEAAVLHNFLWHERWTWAVRRSRDLKIFWTRLLRFNCSTGAISIGGNLAAMEFLVVVLGLPLLLCGLLSVGACAVLNFLCAELWVFRAR